MGQENGDISSSYVNSCRKFKTGILRHVHSNIFKHSWRSNFRECSFHFKFKYLWITKRAYDQSGQRLHSRQPIKRAVIVKVLILHGKARHVQGKIYMETKKHAQRFYNFIYFSIVVKLLIQFRIRHFRIFFLWFKYCHLESALKWAVLEKKNYRNKPLPTC